jgi:hypothetical protein
MGTTKLMVFGRDCDTGNISLRCENCTFQFEWRGQMGHPELPKPGLKYCPNCGDEVEKTRVTPQRRKPDPIMGQTGRDPMVGEDSIMRSVTRGMLGPLG